MSQAIEGRAASVSLSLSLFAVLLWGVTLVRPTMPRWEPQAEPDPFVAVRPLTPLPAPMPKPRSRPAPRERTEEIVIAPPRADEPIFLEPTAAAPSLIAALAPTIANPKWIRRPTEQELLDFYPEGAFFRRTDGRVLLSCLVAANGRLSCAIAEETPRGKGFGRAALDASRLFKIAPQMNDGRPSEGGRISIPINFHIPRN